MTLLEALQQRVGFTRNEALAVLILCGTFLGGIGIRWFQARQPHDAKSIPSFDYSRTDSAYAARSNPLKAPEERNASLAQPQTDSIATAKSKLTTSRRAININTATKAQLINLPGIGPSLADRILAYRAINGQFTSVDELRKVKGIGEKKFAQIRPLVRMN
jgi:comEA protein